MNTQLAGANNGYTMLYLLILMYIPALKAPTTAIELTRVTKRSKYSPRETVFVYQAILLLFFQGENGQGRIYTPHAAT